VKWPRRKPAFVYPIPPAPRTAVLAPWFRPEGLVRVFLGWTREAQEFAPEAVAATLAECEELARIGVPSLSHALIVLEFEGGPYLTEPHRERFWDVFRVPVFEQIIAGDGRLLAAECEAHCGLHVESLWTREDIEVSPCACGRKTPRWFPLGIAQPIQMAAKAGK